VGRVTLANDDSEALAVEPLEVLRVDGISKTFPGTRALDRVSLGFRRGEIHALLGNNGSGKSTLIKVLAGVYSADPGGTITVKRQRFDADRFTPTLAKSLGLHFVHQTPALFPMLSVAENLAIGRGFEVSARSRILWQAQRARAQALIARFHIRALPDQPVFTLKPADCTLVAIARALQDQDGQQEGVLILDEPTAALPGPEVDRLLTTLRRYADAGQTIIYVSHRLEEVLRASDRVSALRDGRHVGTAETQGMDEAQLVALMLGRHVEQQRAQKRAGSGPALLSVRDLSGGPVRGVSFELPRGEVLGIAGLLGAGASELLRLLFGAQPPSAGSVELEGQPYQPASPAQAIARKVAYLPPDRATESSFAALSVRSNLSAVNVGRYFQGLRLRHDQERADSTAAISRFMIRTAGDLQSLSTLSGGNQQKVVLARWLRDDPKLFLLDEPTQGVAVHARAEIHGFLRAAARSGMGLIVVSSDFEELVQLCDRVLVMAQGRIVDAVAGAALDAHRLTELAHFAPEVSV
jgi:ribose transport system ATP-binding protein